MATVRDIDDIVTKLTSDKAKTREEGIKVLNSYLDGGSCRSFCLLLDQHTVKLRPQEIPRSASWPFLLGVLYKCIVTEVSLSKKRGPKLILAKTIRNFVQHAEDVKRSGKTLLLLRAIKVFFNHIWEVIRDVPSFQSEYSNMLRQLLAVSEYRMQMRKKVYSGLVLFYLDKIKTVVCDTLAEHSVSKEELFRYTLTLHSLLENSPGDFPVDLRGALIQGFIEIFSHLRDEGKIARKLLGSLNSFLVKDGPNIGLCAHEIHAAAQDFMVRCWLTTHDRSLKDGLFLYARIQLKLRGILSDGGAAIEQLLDLVVKELDQNNITAPAAFRKHDGWNYDGARDEKLGTITRSQRSLMELAATVLYEACVKVDQGLSAPKRQKKENMDSIVRDRLIKARWLWHGAFCLLIRNHSADLPKPIILDWFCGISLNLERILSDGVNDHVYDGPLWTLRSLQELCITWPFIFPRVKSCHQSSIITIEAKDCWQMIWNSLIHWLPSFSNMGIMIDATFKLLGHLISQNLLPIYSVPRDFWDFRLFCEEPSGSLLYFTASFFSCASCQVTHGDVLHLRRKLLKWISKVLDSLDQLGTSKELAVMFFSAIFSICVGCVPSFPFSELDPVKLVKMHISRKMEDWAELDEEEKSQEDQFLVLDHSEQILAASGVHNSIQMCEETNGMISSSILLPESLRDPLLNEMESCLLGKLSSDVSEKQISLTSLFNICTVISALMYGSFHMNFHRYNRVCDSSQKTMLEILSKAMDKCIIMIEAYVHSLEEGRDSTTSFSSGPFSAITPSTLIAVQKFLSYLPSCKLESVDSVSIAERLSGSVIPFLERLLLSLSKLFDVASGVLQTKEFFHNSGEGLDSGTNNDLGSTSFREGSDRARIVDEELDMDKDLKPVSVGAQKDGDITFVGVKSVPGICFSSLQWKTNMLSIISSFYLVLPQLTCDSLASLLRNEMDPEVHGEILLNLCKSISRTACEHVPSVVNAMNDIIEDCRYCESSCYYILTAIDFLLESLLSLKECRNSGDMELLKESTKVKISAKELKSLASMVSTVAQTGLLMWTTRVKLIDCICDFVLFDPHVAQPLTERLFPMLSDTDYRVRLKISKSLSVLFQTWNGHEELFQDVCCNFGVKLVTANKEKVVTAREVLEAGIQAEPFMETALVTLGQLALSSEKVEEEAVFMICAVAAINPSHRLLICAILDRLAKQINYVTRFKYLEQLMRSILSRWIKAQLNLAALIEMRDLFIVKGEPQDFIQFCCPMLLPPLILKGNESDLNWIAMVASEPVAALVKHHFASIFAACLPLHCGNKKGDQEKAVAVLQGFILRVTMMSEDERDALIKKQMMAIVSSLIDLCHSGSEPQFPYFSKDTIVLAIQTVVDGFLETDQLASYSGVVDKINIFRPDRVFMFLLQIHYQIDSAIHPRHRCHMLARLGVLIDVIRHRTSIPSTCRYLFHIILQSLRFQQLQDQCCHLLSSLFDIFQMLPLKDISHVLGDQLKWVVPKLVACCVSSDISKSGDGGLNSSGCLLALVHRLTVDADRSFHDYIRELDPFPDLECFQCIRNFHQELCFGQTSANEFIKFVERISSLPQELRLRSMQRLHSKLQAREIIILKDGVDMDSHKYGEWPCDPGVVSAVWRLVELCDDDDASDMRELAADFIARVGVGDPYAVVFHLPNDCKENVFCSLDGKNGTTYVSINHNEGVCEELVRAIVKHLQKYILDDSVKIVDLSAKCLRGLLSTEKGQKALRSFGSVARSYIGVQTRGVDLKLVESLLIEIQSKLTNKVIPLEAACLWQTHGKTFEEWICTLVYSLIHHTDDIILRLCQDIVQVKAPLAELVFPHVLGNLAGRSDMSTHVCKLVSTQVKENIFTESNENLRSIQVVLDAMNEFRLRYVLERATSTSESTKRRDTSKSPCLPSSSSSRSSRSSQKKKLDASTPIKSNVDTCNDWEKVYWLQIDYLLAAKAAIQCAAYFTSVLYVEHWCEEHFESLTLGEPDFSHHEQLPAHVELLMKATTKINEPDGIYGIRSHKLASQILTYEHEGNWSKAFENYDLVLRTTGKDLTAGKLSGSSLKHARSGCTGQTLTFGNEFSDWNYHKGLIKSLQQTGCSHVLDLYCQGLAAKEDFLQQDLEFIELQYEAAWRAGKWDFYCISPELSSIQSSGQISRKKNTFNANLHSCLRCLDEGDANTFQMKLKESKQALVSFISQTSRESTQHIHSVIVKLQILDQLSQAWGIRWRHLNNHIGGHSEPKNTQLSGPLVPSTEQLNLLNADWRYILKQMQLHFTLLEPFVAFRRILFQILDCKQCIPEHLLEFATLSRKSGRFSQAATAVHELKLICAKMENQKEFSTVCPLGRIEEAKLLRGQGQIDMAINLTKYIILHYDIGDESADVYRLTGKWLAESQSSSSRNILEQYLKPAVEIAEVNHTINKQKWNDRQCRTHFRLAHYTDALFRSYEERLASSEWQTALRLRNHKAKELEALMKRFKSLTKGERADYGGKIIELQKHVLMDTEEAKRLQVDKDSFLFLALESYQRCLVTGEKYDMRVVFRLVSLWFNFSSNQKVIHSMVNTIKKVQSYKFLPLVYQIASRMGSSKDSQGLHSFQFALTFIVKKMALDHPHHTIFQLLALANGDRIKDKQRSKSAFVIDLDKKHAAEDLLNDLSSHHQELIQQMRQMVEIYIKLAELETKKEDKKIDLPRDIRSVRRLDLVPVITATLPVDRSCQYPKESFPHFNGLCESVIVMNGINAPKVVECLGSDGCKYRQLAKSGNDDLRQDAVMEQFFGLVNTLLQDHSDTRKRHLKIRTYKVVPFTPSAGVLEWVDGTVPLGEYLIGSSRNGGAHGRYRKTDWPFLTCRDHMMMEKDKRKAFQNVCRNFRPVMHHFFLERFSRPADWFEKRLAYSRSVAASSMVGYIVGLGDRHSMNILIDQATAEVVHIDLGVAFEQGLTLKTPEQVPFRLTSDIVDGMGATGVEGVFRRCCEETLSVMRTNKEALLTIIEVFIHDPLYKWALSPLKALQRQKESDDDYTSDVESPDDETEGNKDAARALMRVKQKLDGYEEGEMRSIQGQVQQLIQYSMDSERLCQMYPGWAAWL
ncbi:hypothetical protein SUGI_0330040 [Cryptomeria japonica]|uniref:serine/threonine-protein kinase ATM isoform X2 n=1 Tax=Cryptomeria japonica TaxID=3369 RepID=UPI002408A06C|nr:serine/threonine-protein kinase ATM isoform X2 [Cryptomeria japonica]GLJ18554.1 hypothetical protein SUGI_0330040 [Cryptomeria japonica]